MNAMPPNQALQPTAALPSVPEVTAVRERTVRSTVALRRLRLSLGRSATSSVWCESRAFGLGEEESAGGLRWLGWLLFTRRP